MDTSLDKPTTNLGTSGVNLNMVKMFWNEKMELVYGRKQVTEHCGV